MTRNLKALGLALVGCFAFAAFSASAASAQETEPVAHFTASEYPAYIEGEQINGKHKFVTGGGAVECNTAKFKGEETEGATTSLSVVPTYEGCNLHNNFLGTDTPVTVFMNGCYYTFTVHAGEEDEWSGDTHIVCDGGGPIIIRSYKNEAHTEVHCEYEVTSDTADNIDYVVGAGNPNAIEVNATESATSLTRLKGGLFACGGESQNAKYTGDTEVQTLNENEEPIVGGIAKVET